MKLPSLAFCVLSSLFCVLNCRVVEARSNQAVKAFNEGVQYFNKGQYNEAVRYFDEAISFDRDFGDAYYARGACKQALKAMDSAIMDLGDAIRLNPELLEARSLRGASYYETDRWDAALADFDYVLARKQDPQALLGRGIIYLKRENAAGAEKDFKAFIQAQPNHPLVPKLKEVLASISGAAPAAPAQRSASRPTSRPAPASAAPGRSGPSLQQLADALLAAQGRGLSGKVDRGQLRGERTEAVGDIEHRHGE